MKKIIPILFFFCFSYSYCQKDKLAAHKLITTEIQNFGNDHGANFTSEIKLSDNQIKSELLFLKDLSVINTKKYTVTSIKEGNHLIRIFNAKHDNEKIQKLIEIQSTYTTFNSKKTFDSFNYYITLKNNPDPIIIEFDENGIENYHLKKHKVAVIRECIITYDDNIVEIDISKKKTIVNEANKAYEAFRDQIKKLKVNYFK